MAVDQQTIAEDKRYRLSMSSPFQLSPSYWLRPGAKIQMSGARLKDLLQNEAAFAAALDAVAEVREGEAI